MVRMGLWGVLYSGYVEEPRGEVLATGGPMVLAVMLA